MNALAEAANKIVQGGGEAGYEGKGAVGANAATTPTPDASAADSTSSALPGRTSSDTVDETMLKIHEITAMVRKLQQVRIDIAEQSKTMSESKILEKMTSDDHEVEKREVGTVHVSRDRSKSMEEYTDGTTIRRIDGSIERKRADGTIEQISTTNEVTLRTPEGDISVLAEHDTLLNQKMADGTQLSLIHI